MGDELLEGIETQLVKERDTYKLVIATEGQGSSAYYPRDILESYGPVAFPKGTHSYVGHKKDPNEQRDPEKYIGKLTEDAHWEEGVGLVSRIKPISKYKKWLDEVYEDLGMSMSVNGDTELREMNGKMVKVCTGLTATPTNTVDVVSWAGRGGKLLAESFESTDFDSNDSRPNVAEQEKNGIRMALEDEVKDLIVLTKTALDALGEATQRATDTASENEASKAEVAPAVEMALAVESAEIPDSIKTKLLESVKEGKDVSVELAASVELTKEIKESLEHGQTQNLTEGYSFGTPSNQGAATVSVSGWSAK